MTWDEELAKMAQEWANKCIFDHDPDLCRKTERFPVGQNLAQSSSESAHNESSALAEWASQIRNWFNEFYIFGKEGNNSAHFSQVIWADSHLIGCGYSYYQTQDTKFFKLYFCNYGPGGNIIGKPPYKEGPPECKRKDVRISEHYLGLCEVVGAS